MKTLRIFSEEAQRHPEGKRWIHSWPEELPGGETLAVEMIETEAEILKRYLPYFMALVMTHPTLRDERKTAAEWLAFALDEWATSSMAYEFKETT